MLGSFMVFDIVSETPKDVTSTIRRRVDTSGSTPGDVAEDIPSPSIDKDLMRMDSAMDDWCLQLKRNVLVRNCLFSLQSNIQKNIFIDSF